MKFTYSVFLLIILSLSLLGCGSSAGNIATPPSTSPSSPTGSVNLTWDAPITNADDTPLTDLDGYNVYYGMSPGHYSNSVNLGNQTSVSISGLSNGTWCFAVKAYDISGNISDFSNEICTII